MSALWVLPLAAAASAYGTAVVLRTPARRWLKGLAVGVYVVLGIQVVLLAWLAGDGLILPGVQISPGLRLWYLAEVWQGQKWGLASWPLWAALPVHAALARATRDRLVRLLPTTAFFVAFFFLGRGGPVDSAQVPGPDAVAYLTVAHTEAGARIVVAHGEPGAPYLGIACVREVRGRPGPLHLSWTRDGQVLVLRAGNEFKPSFAVDLEGHVTGALPSEPREWPPERSDAFVPPDVQLRFQQARRDVAEVIVRHGGLYGE